MSDNCNQISQTSLSKVFEINGIPSSNPKEIAKSFNSFFGTIGPQLADKIPPNKVPGTTFRSFLGVPTNHTFTLNNISTEFLKDQIDKLKPKTSYGSDHLSNKLLKLASSHLLLPLQRLINLSLSTGFVPSQMTLAKVIPLLKEGNCKLFTNYRPIAIVSSVGKLLERVVSHQLTNYLETHDLLSMNQYGFRTGHSTSHPLLHFTKKVMESLNKR